MCTYVYTDDEIKDIFKKYAGKVNKDIDHIYFLYGGDMINKEAQLSQFVKGKKEIVIVVLEFSNQEKEQLLVV